MNTQVDSLYLAPEATTPESLIEGATLTEDRLRILPAEDKKAIALTPLQVVDMDSSTTIGNEEKIKNLAGSISGELFEIGQQSLTAKTEEAIALRGPQTVDTTQSTTTSPTAAAVSAQATPTSNGVVSSVALSGLNYIDSLVDGTKWGSGGAGMGANLTYSFGESGTSYYSPSSYPQSGSEPWNGFSPFTATQRNATRNALGAWSELANIQFTEVTDSQNVAGDLRFARSDNAAPTAYAYYPSTDPIGGDVWFSNDSVYDTDIKGTYAYSTFMHEIGHALGLKHPHEADGSGVVANLNTDTTAYTVMSYRSYVNQPIDAGLGQDFYSTSLMLHDIAAIQYIYGANTNTRSGDTVYSWAPGQQILQAIWDGGGTDTIDWSNQSSNATINLNAGAWSQLGPAYWNGQANESKTLAIAYKVTIENATGGSGNDNITGNSVNNILNGGAGNDTLNGGAGNDTLNGEAGNDTLDGGTGIDTLTGAAGNDIYTVDTTADTINELAGGGTDTVKSSVTYTLGATSNLENLTLTGSSAINGTGNALNNIITGNTANNTLNGGDGNDTLNGAAGIDTLTGGAGNDTYVVDTTTDTINEAAGAGTDIVQASVTYTLGATSNLENLTLTGSSAINGTGNALNNIITGNAANNTLNGGDGNDTLNGGNGIDSLIGGNGNDILAGGSGNDVLTGGGGNDQFLYNTNAAFVASAVGVDTINDFSVGIDKIVLDKTTFTAIASVAGTGFSLAGEFASVASDTAAAISAADIVYSSGTGNLFYNQNGTASGFGTGAQFAVFTGIPSITGTDFLIQA